MKIETKFNIGSEVYVLEETKLQKRKIHSFKVDAENNGEINIIYYYRIDSGDGEIKFSSSTEKNIFASKDDFIKQLTEE